MTDMAMQVGVIGGGAWGTALAAHCSRMGHQTLLYAREQEVVEGINNSQVNDMFLKVCTSHAPAGSLLTVLACNERGEGERAQRQQSTVVLRLCTLSHSS